ncbi:MAG: trypsin-like peptidase domain-containing protein [Kiritimatiellae bacterium]|nr:trypsin-like peptidase domain-containing protein [Kiritimatiellia bacterium]
MKITNGKMWPLLLILAWALLPVVSVNAARSRFTPLLSGVIKIYATFQSEDYAMPWQAGRPGNGTGTGFVIAKRRILTNAHVVSNARFLEVSRDGQPGRYLARVEYIAHDCDLAALTVDDPSFFDGITPLELAKAIPVLNDEVTVLGYPTGGDRISVTRGVVSRIDYSGYSHSGVDQHLVLQVDAAINPGNSGGPILFDRRVVGLAFQGLAWADNIGYAIPLPVIRHFLKDIEDGTYNGYPELGAFFLPARNSALRRSLALPADESGVVIYYIDPFGSALGMLRTGDVLLAIDGHDIANDGNIALNGNHVLFAELLERKQWGDKVVFRVWRDGNVAQLTVPLINPCDPFVFRNEYDQRPEYFVYAGLVFAPLSRGFLRTVGDRKSDPNTQQLSYYRSYAKQDDLTEDRDQFVVLIRRLPHSVNTYTGDFLNGIVARVNGRRISTLKDVEDAFASPQEGYHVVAFEGMKQTLVLDAAAADHAAPAIMGRYGVPAPSHYRDQGKAGGHP